MEAKLERFFRKTSMLKWFEEVVGERRLQRSYGSDVGCLTYSACPLPTHPKTLLHSVIFLPPSHSETIQKLMYDHVYKEMQTVRCYRNSTRETESVFYSFKSVVSPSSLFSRWIFSASVH